MATKLFVSDSQTSTHTFDLVPHNFYGKQLFVDSIGGEESSAANDCISYIGTLTLPAFKFDTGGYHSGGFVFDPGGSIQYDLHGFLDSASALSSEETTGHQHPLFLHCPAKITKCPKFVKVPNLISHVLFYFMHGEKVFDDLPVSHKCYYG